MTDKDSTPGKVLSQREVAAFFFPLLLNVQMMTVSHTLINAALARQREFIIALAAYSVAWSIQQFFGSTNYQNHLLAVAVVHGKRSFYNALVYVLIQGITVSALVAFIAFGPAGPAVLNGLMGLEGEVSSQALATLGIIFINPLFVGVRAFFQGIVIRARRNILVTTATVVRIFSLVIFLLILAPRMSGAPLGAAALLGCVIVETILMAFFAWRCGLPEDGKEEKSMGEIVRFALPLSISSSLQMSVFLVINAILGRLADSALALASFGVLRSLILLIGGPMRNLQHAYLTLVHSAQDYRVLLLFWLRTSAAMVLLTAALAFPLNDLFLGRILGLPSDMRHYIALPLACSALFPLLHGATTLLRGYFARRYMSDQVVKSTLLRVVYLAGLGWAINVWPPAVSGLVIGLVLFLSSEVVDSLYLRWQRDRFKRWHYSAK
jgi:hypothetical protein